MRKVRSRVLILIVVDNGLVHIEVEYHNDSDCLNPYCSGQWSRTILHEIEVEYHNES